MTPVRLPSFLPPLPASDEAARAREIAEAEEQERLEASGMGVECGCCFGTVAFERCGSCDDGHLFCVDCIEGHAKNQIGGQVVEVRRACLSFARLAAPS